MQGILFSGMGVAALVAAIVGQQAPTFRSRVDLVTVDATVLGADGRPVEGLGPEAFRLEVDGTPRTLVSVQYVSYDAAAPDLRSPAASNTRYVDGRVVLIAVDQGNIRRVEGGAALKAAAAFVDTLSSADRLAAIPLDSTHAVEFTTDHPAVKRSLSSLLGRAVSVSSEFKIGLAEALGVADGSRAWLDRVVTRVCGQPLARVQRMERMAADEGLRDPCPTHVEQQARAVAHSARSQGEQSVDAVKRLLRRLDDIEGPKTLVLLSEGIIAEPRLVEMTEVALLAQQARATIYVLQVDVPVVEAGDDAISPTMADDVRVRGDGLSRLAGATGGTLLQLVGTDPDPFRRVLRESSGHYLLAFEPRPEDRDGATHRISVSVRRPSITVRARPVFSAPPPPVAAVSVEDQLVQLLRNRRIATDLAVGLGVTAVRAAVGSTVQAHATIRLDPPADATFGAVVVNSGGTVVTSATSRTTTGQLSFPVGVAPGRYLFRGAVIDPSGRAGTVERTLDIALRGDRLKMSDLVLTAAVPAAGELPVVERVTASELRAALQIYAPRDWAAAANVRLELASAGGGVRTPGRGATAWVDEGFWLASGTFDVGSLPSGRYVVSAAVPGEAPVTRSVFLVR